jgi:hypothetical protein
MYPSGGSGPAARLAAGHLRFSPTPVIADNRVCPEGRDHANSGRHRRRVKPTGMRRTTGGVEARPGRPRQGYLPLQPRSRTCRGHDRTNRPLDCPGRDAAAPSGRSRSLSAWEGLPLQNAVEGEQARPAPSSAASCSRAYRLTGAGRRRAKGQRGWPRWPARPTGSTRGCWPSCRAATGCGGLAARKLAEAIWYMLIRSQPFTSARPHAKPLIA